MYPNLKIEIFKRGLHQNVLARDLGLNEAILSKIIRGNLEPTGTQKQILAQYLQADENWLFEKFVLNPSSRLPVNGGVQAKKDDEL
jgi:transcriptional regulator with XRE-family HTH domain